MAWMSAGTSNDDLIDQLVENGVIGGADSDEALDAGIERAFRCTDRGDFVDSRR